MTRLGSGSFGVVELEWDELTGRNQAVKYIPAVEGINLDQCFEPKAMALAEHENVVRIHHAEHRDEKLVLRMEYLPGGSVQDRYQGNPVPVRRALDIIEDACRGVQHLHSQGLLHHDIKPANLLIDGQDRVKVSDFGLASLVASPRTSLRGAYIPVIPPECCANASASMTREGDVYALGCTAYRLLNGDELFYGAYPSDGRLEQAIAAGSFPNRRSWLPHVHKSLRTVINLALHPDPSKRYNTPSDFRSALTRVQPKVSWEQMSHGVWMGRSTTGVTWKSTLEMTAVGHAFRLRKGKTQESLREVRAAQLMAIKQSEVEWHAAKVLQRVAQHGSW